MEASTGKILFSESSSDRASIASVTKVMTLLLVSEALKDGSIRLDDKVLVSKNAASMGGSQVFLEEGERFTVEELIKCTVIASANDAAVALAELVSGSESAFVRKMNDRAVSLGLKNTHFENCTGLDDTTSEHYSSAEDIAVMSRELLNHSIITKYSGVWQDTIRNGEFTLTNTNRLVRYYDGCNGLKTGSTDKAGFCVSATAKRDNMQLIAVVLGAKTRDERNEAARSILDFGFSSYKLYKKGEETVDLCPVYSGKKNEVALYSSPVSFLIERSSQSKLETVYELPEHLASPVKAGESVGCITYKINGQTVAKSDVYSKENVEKLGVLDIFFRILKRMSAG